MEAWTVGAVKWVSPMPTMSCRLQSEVWPTLKGLEEIGVQERDWLGQEAALSGCSWVSMQRGENGAPRSEQRNAESETNIKR